MRSTFSSIIEEIDGTSVYFREVKGQRIGTSPSDGRAVPGNSTLGTVALYHSSSRVSRYNVS